MVVLSGQEAGEIYFIGAGGTQKSMEALEKEVREVGDFDPSQQPSLPPPCTLPSNEPLPAHSEGRHYMLHGSKLFANLMIVFFFSWIGVSKEDIPLWY